MEFKYESFGFNQGRNCRITQTNLVFVYRAGRVCYSSLPFLMPSDFTALHGAIQYSMNFTQWMTALLD